MNINEEFNKVVSETLLYRSEEKEALLRLGKDLSEKAKTKIIKAINKYDEGAKRRLEELRGIINNYVNNKQAEVDSNISLTTEEKDNTNTILDKINDLLQSNLPDGTNY